MKGQGRLFDGFLALLALMGVLIAALAVVAMATRPDEVVAAGETDNGVTPGGETAAVTAAITLSEFTIEGDLEIQPGNVTFEMVNQGAVVHNLAIDGVGQSEDINGGASGTWEAGELAAGSYELICAIPGHKEAGMKATLVVAGGGASTETTMAHGGEEMDYAALDQAMTDSILAFPAETEGRGNLPLEPTVEADGTKVFELTAEIVDWEVAPGQIVKAWAYNGMVPGPMIKVGVGESVKVRLTNNLPMGTDLHMHGVPGLANTMDGVAPLTQPLIKPGETFEYSFVTDAVAVAMYHAHHHAQMQVPNGLFGTFMVGDVPLPLGRTISGVAIPEAIEIAAEIPMVLNDAGVIGFSLNGKSFPATEPYVLTEGDWFLVHYFNEGLQIHPMHQHQFNGLVIAKDGIPLESPYWVDTLNVAPGERYTVLTNADDPGAWVWHCHVLNHVEREEGMFGMVTAIIVNEAA